MEAKVNKIDIWILVPILALIAFSLAVVYSASSSWSVRINGDSSYLFRNHLIRAVFGITMIFVFARIDYLHLIKFRKAIFILAAAFLLYLVVSGIESTKGAARWIRIGNLSFQPADYVKYALIINLSYLLYQKKNYVHSLYRAYLPMLAYVIIVVVLIAMQPNFSTAAIVFASSLMLFFVGRVKLKHLLITVISVIPFACIYILSKPYIINRILSYAGSTNGNETSYQLSQAMIGFGNGSWLGVGPGNSNQKEFFLPQSYDDFVFSILGEEYGFLGVMLVISLFGIFVYRGMRCSRIIEDDFGKYLAFGITLMIGMNAVINMMVASGIIPVTGQTLPFISYGGTSIIFNSIAVGILLNISTHRLHPLSANWAERLAREEDD